MMIVGCLAIMGFTQSAVEVFVGAAETVTNAIDDWKTGRLSGADIAHIPQVGR